MKKMYTIYIDLSERKMNNKGIYGISIYTHEETSAEIET